MLDEGTVPLPGLFRIVSSDSAAQPAGSWPARVQGRAHAQPRRTALELELHGQLDKTRQVALIHRTGYAAEIPARDGCDRAAEELRRVEAIDEVGAEDQVEPLGQT